MNLEAVEKNVFAPFKMAMFQCSIFFKLCSKGNRYVPITPVCHYLNALTYKIKQATILFLHLLLSISTLALFL